MTRTSAWDWLGEPLAVDFANTVKRRGSRYVELLRDGADVAAWCARERGRVPRLDGPTATARLDEIRATRDDVFAVLSAVADRRAGPRSSAERLDARARRFPVVAQLRGGPVVLNHPDSVDELLARVTHAAIALAGEPGGLAFCDAPSCGQFFIRDRPNRQWCGPACGTRARVARHAGHGVLDYTPKTVQREAVPRSRPGGR
jgi:hypothetical protein